MKILRKYGYSTGQAGEGNRNGAGTSRRAVGRMGGSLNPSPFGVALSAIMRETAPRKGLRPALFYVSIGLRIHREKPGRGTQHTTRGAE